MSDDKAVKALRKKDAEGFYLKTRKRIFAWMKNGKLNRKTGRWTDDFIEYLLVFPDLIHLMIKLFTDREVSPKIKGYIVFGLAYLISPIDFIPDFIPVAGLIDDLLVSVIIINKIINSGDQLTLDKIKLYWAGESDVFEKVREIVLMINDVSSRIPGSFVNFLKRRK